MSLRIILLINSLMLLSSICISQTESVYKKSLIYHFSNTNTDTIYILKCSDIKLPSKVGKYQLIELDNVNEFLKSSNNVNVVKLMPLQLNGATINIVLIDYFLERNEEGEITMGNMGSEIFTYEYNRKGMFYKLIKRKKNSI